jgi:hypothetical protein
MKLTRFNEVSFTIEDLAVGDVFQVGSNFYLEIDAIPEALKVAFDDMNAAVLNWGDSVSKNLKEQNIKMSPNVFAHLMAFTKVMAKKFPNLSASNGGRIRIYNDKKTVKLSELFDKGLFECAEFAAVAQLYLQSVGIKSKHVSGDYLKSLNQEYSDGAHSYNIVQDKDDEYVFDPANPEPNAVPNIAKILLTPKQKVKMQAQLLEGIKIGSGNYIHRTAYFETKSIWNDRKIYYGLGTGGSWFPQTVFHGPKDMSFTNIKDGRDG